MLIPIYCWVPRVDNTDNIQTEASGQTGQTPKTITKLTISDLHITTSKCSSIILISRRGSPNLGKVKTPSYKGKLFLLLMELYLDVLYLLLGVIICTASLRIRMNFIQKLIYRILKTRTKIMRIIKKLVQLIMNWILPILQTVQKKFL